MNITELDEFQGLTEQMVREWLQGKGAVCYEGYWRHSLGIYPDGACGGLLWADTLHALARDFCKSSVQAVLREINPRMRPWPSRHARSAHDGLWMVVVSDDETGAIGRFRNDVPWFSFNEDANGDGNILSEENSFALYWPCDANGNKVRWPTDSEGNML